MSHPVFLESPPWPRMPEGRKGELPAYYASGRPSLESNGTIPLFWQALFGTGDLRHAFLIDDFDPQSEQDEIAERFESGSDQTEDSTYPYLITSREQALARLKMRRERLLALVGERYRPIYDAFMTYIDEHYAKYILLRTSGLPDVEDATPWLVEILDEMDRLDHAGMAPALAEEARRATDGDAVWEVTGSCFGQDDALAWPSPSLIAAFPACAPAQRRSYSASGASTDSARSAYTRPDTRLDRALEWLASLVFAAVFLVTFGYTRSIWKSLLATAVVTVLMVWGLLRLKRRR